MFRGNNHTTTEAVIELIRTLPEREQKVIVKTLTTPKKKVAAKAKRKQQILSGIAKSLLEAREAKRTGKKLKTLDQMLNEI